MHLDPNNKNMSCGFPTCLDLGYYDLDSPPSLVNLMAENLATNPIDAILINGDFVAHGYSSKNPDVNKWN